MANPTATAVLKELAAEARVKTWEQDYGLYFGLFTLHCRFTRNGRKIECDANDDLLSVRLRCSSAITFVIGTGTLMWMWPSTEAVAPIKGLPVFVSPARMSETVDWLHQRDTEALFERVGLGHGERMKVDENEAHLFLLPGDTSLIWRRIDATSELVATLPPAPRSKTRFSKSDVPKRLHAALTMLSRWAISDDQDRDDRIRHARTRSLVALRDAVTPLLGDIDAYIDGFGSAPAETATRLGDLAQAAIEASEELSRRSPAR